MKSLLWKKTKIFAGNVLIIVAAALTITIIVIVSAKLGTLLKINNAALPLLYVALLVLSSQVLRSISNFSNVRAFSKLLCLILLSVFLELSLHIPFLIYTDYADNLQQIYQKMVSADDVMYYIIGFFATTLGAIVGSYFVFFLLDKTLSWIQKRKTK
jgi:hypothetical protein